MKNKKIRRYLDRLNQQIKNVEYDLYTCQRTLSSLKFIANDLANDLHLEEHDLAYVSGDNIPDTVDAVFNLGGGIKKEKNIPVHRYQEFDMEDPFERLKDILK